MASYGYGGWAPYVSVAQKREKAEKMLKALKKKGRICHPIVIEKRTIARTFWGKKWCENLENYSDYENRLPRGRTYVRNGSVIDLQITPEKISALVAGSSVYEVAITIRPLEKSLWESILQECAGKVASLVELLQGRLSGAVMQVVTQADKGLFPTPKHISFRCSCPDSASMCKHIAATLYGVGARLDEQPELLFRLRNVNPGELIQQAVNLSVTQVTSAPNGDLADSDLSALFGIDMDESQAQNAPDKAAIIEKNSVKKYTGSKPVNVKAVKAVKVNTISANELTARGIPAHTRQSWLKSGILLTTDQRGVYGVVRQTEKTIRQYLARS
jgi:uncharacterized Zn finger protein